MTIKPEITSEDVLILSWGKPGQDIGDSKRLYIDGKEGRKVH